MENKSLAIEVYTKQEIDDLINDLKKPTIYIKGVENSFNLGNK